MYPSSSYFASDNNNLISYEINSTSKQDPIPQSLYYNIPSPYGQYDNADVFTEHMFDVYLQQQSQVTEVNEPGPIPTEMAEKTNNIQEILGECTIKQNESVVVKEISKKKTSKKDRHSKIETAQGPRDRRMRLSLQVARDFFDLQDTLGYNKASKTVAWLLTKSKDAIKDLTNSSANSPSSTLECEVVSHEKTKDLVPASKEIKSTRGSTRKSSFNPLSKELREKARERARERTKEKRKGDGTKNGLETTMSHQMNTLGPWCQDDNNSYQIEMLDEVGELSSSMIFNYDMHNNGVAEEHQFTDFNLYGKPWDAYKQY